MEPQDTATDAPTQRILIIAEAISRHGPITLAQLTDRLQISRGAIWRALDTLRTMGWVRMRLGDNAYEIRSTMIDSFQHGHKSLPVIEQIAPLIARVLDVGPVHVDIGCFTESGVFQIVESTRKVLPIAPLALCSDELALAVQLSLSPQILVGHLRTYMTIAPSEERRIITSGTHSRHLASLRDGRIVWQHDRLALSFPLADYIGFGLRAELWRTGKADIEQFTARMPMVAMSAMSR